MLINSFTQSNQRLPSFPRNRDGFVDPGPQEVMYILSASNVTPRRFAVYVCGHNTGYLQCPDNLPIEMSRCRFEKMPAEIILHITHSITTCHIITLSQTCRFFNEVIRGSLASIIAHRDPDTFTRLLFLAVELKDDSLFRRLLHIDEHHSLPDDEQPWAKRRFPISPANMVFCSPLPRKDLLSICAHAGRATILSPITGAHYPDLGKELLQEERIRYGSYRGYKYYSPEFPAPRDDLVYISGLSDDTPDMLSLHSWHWSG